jgi:hypothetical protein
MGSRVLRSSGHYGGGAVVVHHDVEGVALDPCIGQSITDLEGRYVAGLQTSEFKV